MRLQMWIKIINIRGLEGKNYKKCFAYKIDMSRNTNARFEYKIHKLAFTGTTLLLRNTTPPCKGF